MVSQEAAAKLQEELSCSICLETFSDPVSIHCGHNFCRACITNYWSIGKNKTFSCPRCRETSRKKIVKPNLELKNIVEIAPMLHIKVAKDGGKVTCKKHQEPLKLFCKDDQTLICVVCDKSKEHQNHVVLPLEEAAQDYQKQIQEQLKYMRQEKEQLLAFKAIGTAKNKESWIKIKSEMQKAESVFQQAHEFLNEQKQFLLAQWESLESAAEKRNKELTSKLSENVSCLDSLITEAEGRSQRPAAEFLQNVKSTLTRCKKRKFQELIETSSELEESIDSLIRKNVVIEEILQKIKDTLPSYVEKDQWKSSAVLETKKEEARKRKMVRHMTVPVRNMNVQQFKKVAACSTTSSDGGSGSRMSSPGPSRSDKRPLMGEEYFLVSQQEALWRKGVRTLNSGQLELERSLVRFSSALPRKWKFLFVNPIFSLQRAGICCLKTDVISTNQSLGQSVAYPGREWKTKLDVRLRAKRIMDANSLLGSLRKEASCSICLGYFQDSVSIHCGHNFCRACITQCWGEAERNVSCPQCGESSQLRSFTDNQPLARIAEIVKCFHQEAVDVLEGRRMCERHQELLNIFCKDDKIPICLVCDISKEHRHHAVIPMEEAVDDYKEQFQKELKTLKQRRGKLQALKSAEERRSRTFLVSQSERLGNEGERVVSEFEQLHQFLEDQEQILLAKLEQLENEVIKEKMTITSKLSKEISNLSDLISEIEEKCKQPMNEFLQDIKNTLNRCENQIQQPVEHSPDLEKKLDVFSEESKHLEKIRKKLKDALSSELESTSLLKHVLGIQKGRTKLFELPYAEVVKKTGRRVNVTLDPDTANPFLVLSADQKSVRLGDEWQDVPDNAKRFDTYPCVLGCEGFTSGRYYWEVEVGSGRYWAVGFAKESVRRKGEIIPSPEEHIWALQQYGDYFEALTYPVTTLSLSSWPRRVQVFLDYEEDRVAFFDADTAALIYVFSPATFSQERILPWLWVWPGTELRLYH
ncbi:uncharacterized protein LOC129327701 [Eublepharis macularius]|uniref:Uncharacterized protein LOC129327701 n=1 Tax=Eublepharis macularius TaxID=481883 RepID=A0AA97KVE1_EUBMA|nr:uncharacterized protein LOC129327701 [Eublepharis macularius]